ncbi:GPI transamidase component PIG-T-like isoform X2 [Dysidea avara]|uniref:GPI transamidase component PIG-T-like isoform X2 n=2 Tax=Dysidea avara TaxID=196820 RepID=UPI003324DD43
MLISMELYLKALLFSLVLFAVSWRGNAEGLRYYEELYVRPLLDGKVMNHFVFTTQWDVSPEMLSRSAVNEFHYDIFPKPIGQIIQTYGVQEFHLSLTRGRWKTRLWGYPPLFTPPGTEAWAWFLPGFGTYTHWKGLVNSLSGLLCTSLSSIDVSSTYRPSHSFMSSTALIGNISSLQLYYAAMPWETVCTENLTPWKKLLPCEAKAGLAQLLLADKLFNNLYHSLGLHLVTNCLDEGCTNVGLQLQMTLTLVHNPTTLNDVTEWSLQQQYGTRLKSSCPLATASTVYIDSTGSKEVAVEYNVKPSTNLTMRHGDTEWAMYNLTFHKGERVNLNTALTWKSKETVNHPLPVVDVMSYITGSGHEWGGLVVQLCNRHPTESVNTWLLSMVPWFVRLYYHTMTVTIDGSSHTKEEVISYQVYTPAKDRTRPHTLEMMMSLPAHSTVTISIEFRRALLKWTEYPPDAHHGFYINSATVTTLLPLDYSNVTLLPHQWHQLKGYHSDQPHRSVVRIYSEPILVTLSTPDFSMPYNVICFVCTIVAIGFGSLYNLSIKDLKPASSSDERLIVRIWKRLKKLFVSKT